jgi:hypothetical protein
MKIAIVTVGTRGDVQPVEKLAAAIQTAVSDEIWRSRAVSLGQKIRAENGVARAVEAIENVCKTSTFRRNAATDPKYL